MQFWGEIGQNNRLAPPPFGWRRLLCEIADPPLYYNYFDGSFHCSFWLICSDMASLIPSGAEDDIPDRRDDEDEDQSHSLGSVAVNVQL